MKKTIFIVVVLFFLPIAVNAFSDVVPIGPFQYGLNDTDRTATLLSYSGQQTDISIPQHAIYNNITYDVTRIGGCAFSNNTDIISVSIPEGVKVIEVNAFAYCTNLASITIPSSIEKVETDAFMDTPWFSQLKENACGRPIYIGTTLYDAGDISPYSDENGRSLFVVADGTTYISGYAFSSSSMYEVVEIPGSVKTIESYAFDGNSYITSIIIHEGVEEIGSWGFRNCSNLESISIPNSLKEIGSDVFEGTGWYDSQDDGVVYAGKIAYKYKGVMPADTTRVFVYICVSKPSRQNGRKVTRKYIRIAEKIKI